MTAIDHVSGEIESGSRPRKVSRLWGAIRIPRKFGDSPCDEQGRVPSSHGSYILGWHTFGWDVCWRSLPRSFDPRCPTPLRYRLHTLGTGAADRPRAGSRTATSMVASIGSARSRHSSCQPSATHLARSCRKPDLVIGFGVDSYRVDQGKLDTPRAAEPAVRIPGLLRQSRSRRALISGRPQPLLRSTPQSHLGKQHHPRGALRGGRSPLAVVFPTQMRSFHSRARAMCPAPAIYISD